MVKCIAYSTSGRGHTSDFTHEQMAVAHELLFVCDRFPQGKIVSGKFTWIRQKEEKNSVPMTVTDVSSMG